MVRNSVGDGKYSTPILPVGDWLGSSIGTDVLIRPQDSRAIMSLADMWKGGDSYA
jgi:hypothetical protein